MGLFTGLFYDKCPKCGELVSKRARFCSKCGNGAPEGWIKCPNCGKWVGNESEYCPHCDHPLHPSERINLAGGVWDREPGLFAQRFELGDVRFIKENGLLIQEGTVAVLMDGGKQSKVLGPGRHKPEGMLRDINWFGNPPPRSAVMVDSGDCVFRLDFSGLNSGGLASAEVRSAEELKVTAVAEVTLRFDRSRADDFLENFMKDRREVGVKDVIAQLYEEALSTVRDLCQQSTIEDLVKDPDRRDRFEEAIARALKDPLKRYGLELVRVGAVEFIGAVYEELREKYAELEKSRRLVEFEKKQLELLSDEEKMRGEDATNRAEREAQGKMTTAERAKRVEDYLAQLAQEKEIGEISRTQELQIAVRVAKGEVSRTEAQQEMARLTETHAKDLQLLANKLELDLTLKNYDREQLVKDAENKAERAAIARREAVLDAKNVTVVKGEEFTQAEIDDRIKRLTVRREQDEAREWAKIKAEIDAQKLQRKMDWAKMLRDFPEEKILAVLEDPAMRADFQRHLQRKHEEELLKIRSGMTSDQIMAEAVGAGGTAAAAAANAWAFAQGAKENASAQVLAEVKQQQQDRIAHDEKLFDKISELAKTAVEHQTTNVIPPVTPVTNNLQH